MVVRIDNIATEYETEYPDLVPHIIEGKELESFRREIKKSYGVTEVYFTLTEIED